MGLWLNMALQLSHMTRAQPLTMIPARHPAPSLPEWRLVSAGLRLLDTNKQKSVSLQMLQATEAQTEASPPAFPSTSSRRLAVELAVPSLERSSVQEKKSSFGLNRRRTRGCGGYE